MNDNLIRRFCESRYRWPIVATATLLVAVATVVPLADEYFDKRNNGNELSDELIGARQTAEDLPKFESRVAEVRQKLSAFQSRTVDEQSTPRFRNRIVDLVRQSGCQIRRIEVGQATIRPWKEGDVALDEGIASKSTAATPFNLERRSVVLAVDGSMSAIHDLLDRLEKEQTLAHPHRLQLQGATGDGESVTLDLELWMFTLARAGA